MAFKWLARRMASDTAREKYGEYIVTLWLFHNHQNFQHANERGLYPRIRQLNLPNYRNLSSNAPGYPRNFDEFRNALQPYEGTGEVRAVFMGLKEIVHFRRAETFTVADNGFLHPQALQYYYPANPEGPVLAIGAANLSTKFDKHGIKRIRNQIRHGLTASSLNRLQADLEQLSWHWHPITIQARFGELRGRVVNKDTLQPPNPPNPPTHGNHAALQWAHNAYIDTNVEGLNGHDVNLTFQIPGINGNHTVPAITQTIENVDGRFEFLGVPMGVDLTIASDGQHGFNQGRLEFPNPLPQLENASQTALNNVIISKKKRVQGNEEVVIIPTQHEGNLRHTNHLQRPFGPMRVPYIEFAQNTRAKNIPLPFKISTSKNVQRGNPPERYYHVFFMETPGRLVDYNRLTNQYNVRNIKITFKQGGDERTVGYSPTFPHYTQYWINKNTTITLEANFNRPNTGRTYSMLIAFVSVQKERLEPRLQQRLDLTMYGLATTGNQAYVNFLQHHGVLDFNLIPVILRNMTPIGVRGEN